MVDQPDSPHTGETGVAPDRGSTAGAPRWVKVIGIIGLLVVLLAVVMMFAVGGGEHGPGRHAPGGDTSGLEAPEGEAAPPEGGHG